MDVIPLNSLDAL